MSTAGNPEESASQHAALRASPRRAYAGSEYIVRTRTRTRTRALSTAGPSSSLSRPDVLSLP